MIGILHSIAGAVQRRVTDALHGMAGLNVEKVTVEVTDTMTREDYRAKTASPTAQTESGAFLLLYQKEADT